MQHKVFGYGELKGVTIIYARDSKWPYVHKCMLLPLVCLTYILQCNFVNFL